MYPLAPKARQPDHESVRDQQEDKYTVYENRPGLPHLDSGRNPLYSQTGQSQSYQTQNYQGRFGGNARGGLIRGVLGQGLKLLDH